MMDSILDAARQRGSWTGTESSKTERLLGSVASEARIVQLRRKPFAIRMGPCATHAFVPRHSKRLFLLAATLGLIGIVTGLRISARESSTPVDQLRATFLNPPDNCRILMRWWWFGPSVEDAELNRELEAMKAAGVGGVEIQPVYPLQLDTAQQHNTPYLSLPFLHAVHYASGRARELGLRVDVTLGSGWPYGGPHTSIEEAAGRLRVEHAAVSEGTSSVHLPALESGETLLATFVGGQRVANGAGGRLSIPAGLSGADLVSFFIAGRTGQQVKRSAVGAEGFVLDHYSRRAIENHLSSVAEPLLRSIGDYPPYSVFSDSLEVYGSDWTSNLLSEFQKRRGYDLAQHLPELVDDTGPNTPALRHDWAKTLTELAEDNYLKPIRDWAHTHGTLFRSQTYGEPPVILSSNQFVDLPEGEHGPYWRRFSAARWAASGAHLYSRPVVSAETWTWLHSPSFRATPLDLKAEADRHFLQGVNQLVGHGWPYSPPGEAEPGWRFYAAAALNDHNPWFDAMPAIAAYLQRVSFILRQGEPTNDVAMYLPTDDAWSRLRLGKVSVDEMADTLLGPVLIPAVLNAGYNFDFIDDRAMSDVGIPYKLVILPGIERIPLATMRRLQSFIAGGGRVIATRSLPSLGIGLLEEKSETAAIRDLSQRLFATSKQNTRFVLSDGDIPAALHELLPPDFTVDPAAAAAVGFVHRKLPGKEIYFIANTSNRLVSTMASVRIIGLHPQWWDLFNGAAQGAPHQSDSRRTQVPLILSPYESKLLIFTPDALPSPAPAGPQTTLDLSADWTVTFLGSGQQTKMLQLHSWTDDESTRFYSGRAVYTKTFQLEQGLLSTAHHILLDFGPGTQVEPNVTETPGMHAMLESPVREEAVVVINGKQAGVVWHPPYRLDVTPHLRAGSNDIKITVGNLAINELAGHAPAEYRLLNLRYGERFTPQDMTGLKPLPSGLLHTITLVSEP